MKILINPLEELLKAYEIIHGRQARIAVEDVIEVVMRAAVARAENCYGAGI